ncbi:MAG TPA: DUF4331 family protein [Kofleriaceae bacterium]|nr:DUF4331 family protein [Kofleriaceae bacterium]
MRTLTSTLCGTAALALILSACGGDDGGGGNNPPPPDGGNPGSGTVAFHQVEHLARPGINEALLFTSAYLNGYNATAPSFTGVDQATLGQVVGEAKTVLRAIYLGACFINGAAGLTADTGVHPAGMTCHAVGAALFNADGVTQTQASIDASNKYADAVFNLFEPDVMRIDTSAPSDYLGLCGAATNPNTPLLCGGRRLTDDSIDITYDFLLNGADQYLNPSHNNPQFIALTSDGVSYSTTNAAMNSHSLSTPDAKNAAQGHPDTLATFPYSAPPF